MEGTTFDPVIRGTVPAGVKVVHVCGWILGPVGKESIPPGGTAFRPERYCSLGGTAVRVGTVAVEVVHDRRSEQ